MTTIPEIVCSTCQILADGSGCTSDTLTARLPCQGLSAGSLALCSGQERGEVLRSMLTFLLHGVPVTPKSASSMSTLVLVAERAAIDTLADGLQSGMHTARDAHIYGPALVR